ncbi:hypothetical protein niasHT_032631 [Heterodera trifolii]|uniref:Uncharacterized protein n=1 Tax=Heterodera trifolii TaxID=157864 RepID=A0ABD2I6G0_9BILA
MNRRKAFSRNLNPLRERRPRGRPPKGGQPTFLNAGRSPKMLPATPPTSFTLRGRRRVSSSRVLWRARKIDDEKEEKEIILCRRHRAHLWNLTNKSSERHPADKLVQITRELRVMFLHLRRHQRQQQRKHFCRTFGKKLSIKNCFKFSISKNCGGGHALAQRRRTRDGRNCVVITAPPPTTFAAVAAAAPPSQLFAQLAQSSSPPPHHQPLFAQSLRPSPILLHSPLINDQHR